jgi:murein DD-endopeptidase MepM/ murein hydrolase activator NlpD
LPDIAVAPEFVPTEMPGSTNGFTEGSFGSTSNAGGEWSTLDSMNPFIQQAGASTGVPPNLIKAMLAREGGFGRDKWVANLRGEQVYAFNGIFRSTAQSYGIDFDRMVKDDSYAVWAMGRVLQGIKENNPNLGSWDNVAKYYFAGPNWNNGSWGDETGQNTVDNYAYGPSGVITRWKTLDQQSGFTGTSTFGTGTGSWESIVKGGAVYDWGEFGAESSNGLYGYGTQYGMNGTQHTGADIATPRGSTYVAPMGGTVMCAGTGIGTGADGSGCAAFGDTGGGAGRVEVLLDNGAVLIYGHSSQSFLQPGQRFNAGQALGKSGTMNSDHIHLEARVKDPSTASGWRIVDARTVMGGGGGGTTPAAPQNAWDKYMANLDLDRINANRPRW